MADADGEPVGVSRRERAYELIAAEPVTDGVDGAVDSLRRLCRVLCRELSIMAAAVNLMSDEDSHGVAAGSDERSLEIDELQFTLGEGPCHDALAERRPVLVADLQGPDGARWPGYSPAAREAGVAAAFAFPLRVGGAGFGVLDVYADRPGSLSREQVAMSLTFADVATRMLLDAQMATPPGQLEPSLESALDYRAQIYQAQGMVMVDLGVNLSEALSRMRAHAYTNDLRLADLAREIVAGRMRLESDLP